MEPDYYEGNEPRLTSKSQEKLEENWLKCLEKDFKKKIEKYNNLAIKNDWILPNDPLQIFHEYFSQKKIEVENKYKNSPQIIVKKYDDETKSDYFENLDKVHEELYTISYELLNRSIIHFPEPEIPETFLLDWIKKKKGKINNLGLFSSHSENKLPISKTSKSQNRLNEILTLKQLFFKKYGNNDKYNKIKDHLFNINLLSEDKTSWIGIGMNGKIQLVSLIKFIGIKFLQKSLSEKQIVYITEQDFNLKASLGSVKAGNSENGEYYLKDF